MEQGCVCVCVCVFILSLNSDGGRVEAASEKCYPIKNISKTFVGEKNRHNNDDKVWGTERVRRAFRIGFSSNV